MEEHHSHLTKPNYAKVNKVNKSCLFPLLCLCFKVQKRQTVFRGDSWLLHANKQPIKLGRNGYNTNGALTLQRRDASNNMFSINFQWSQANRLRGALWVATRSSWDFLNFMQMRSDFQTEFESTKKPPGAPTTSATLRQASFFLLMSLYKYRDVSYRTGYAATQAMSFSSILKTES